MGRRAVSRSRRVRAHPGTDPLHLREHCVQHERVDHLRPVAVLRTDRIGEPAQLATRTGLPFDPTTIVPTESDAAEGAVVLPGARRSSRAVDGDMDLVGVVEPVGQHSGQEPGQTGGEVGAQHERPVGGVGPGLELHQLVDVVDRVGGRDDVGATAERFGGNLELRRRSHHHDDRCVECLIELAHHGAGAARPGYSIRGVRADVMDHHPARRQPTHDVPDGSPPDHAGADDRDDDGVVAHRRFHEWLLGNSRQPPCCGGMPPLPRTRSVPAIRPPTDSAISARRIAFTMSCYLGSGYSGSGPSGAVSAPVDTHRAGRGIRVRAPRGDS